MARTTEVQYAAVAQACTELFRSGESVSFAKVYLAIGSKGGQQVVSDMIRRWRQESAAQLIAKRDHPSLPDALLTASDTLVEEIWKLALAQAEATYQAKMGELALKESDWSVRLDQAADQLAAVERDKLLLQGELTGVKATLQGKEAALAEQESRSRELQAALAARDDQVTALREDLARTLATLEAERTRHDEVLQTVQRQHEETVQQENARHAATVAQVHQQADADRRHFMAQTDELRQAHKQQAEQLRDQLAGERAAAESYRAQAYTARDEASRWKGRAEVIQEELDKVKKILAKVQKHREGK